MPSAARTPTATRRCSRHSLRGWTRRESAERARLSTPALRIGVGDAGDLAERRQGVERREDDLQDEGGGRGAEIVFADDRFDDLEGGRFGVDVGEVRADFVEQLVRFAAGPRNVLPGPGRQRSPSSGSIRSRLARYSPSGSGVWP